MSEASDVAEMVLNSNRAGPSYRVENLEHPDGTKAVVVISHSTDNGEACVEIQEVTKHFDANRSNPIRRVGTAAVSSLESFVDHVKRFADEDSAIFADRNPASPKLLAVLDYHRRTAAGLPRFGYHRTQYDFPLSDEWKAWKSKNGARMSQPDFAQWVEDHLADIVDPAIAGKGAQHFLSLLSCGFANAQKLLELSRGLTVHVGARVANHTNLASGEASIIFEAKHTDEKNAPLKVPGAFLLGIPVFKSGAPYQIAARLRYRVNGGEVHWSYELFQADAVFDHAIDEACEAAKKGTGLPVFQGKPEA